MVSPSDLFDAVDARARKEAGMALAARNNPELLAFAQQVAREHAVLHDTVTSDDVAAAMHFYGKDWESLGNARGSVFRGQFEWTGAVVASRRPSTHARMIKVWRLKK